MATKLGRLEKVLRASPGRKTRFHTMRDEMVPFVAVAQLPSLAMRRLAGRAPEGPWFSTGAVRFLERIIQPQWRVLELGSGRSTVWYAQRAASVTALEDQSSWHTKVDSMLARYANASVELLPAADFPTRIDREASESVDLLIVDSNEQDASGTELPPELDRTGCVLMAMPKVRPGGLLILDNSDLPRYRRVDDLLVTWHSVRITGFPTAPFTPTETTFYWKPTHQAEDASPRG